MLTSKCFSMCEIKRKWLNKSYRKPFFQKKFGITKYICVRIQRWLSPCIINYNRSVYPCLGIKPVSVQREYDFTCCKNMWIELRPEEIYSRNKLCEVKNNMLTSAEKIFILTLQKILENVRSSLLQVTVVFNLDHNIVELLHQHKRDHSHWRSTC